ncbi:glycoside hydrolase family 2 protein [Lacticaseibacillus parakribbianus]|uniref:glycoside hydrolase family 2 protein n=1 Tax=Lacticaseibacillus parakribbianus TaxID=2970927 RepID=UPI0021CB52AA|nr:sugar-binding domain-containing protein [Lacticaseibacillus parakribbianus]
MTIPRPEFPEPMMQRTQWQNLNGQWDFLIDAADSGRDQHFETTAVFDRQITVPYPPESQLSGIGNVDFMAAVWYRRHFTVTAAQRQQVVRLHFGAVDYHATVFVNGQVVGQHDGGFVPFAFDIQAQLQDGDNTLVVCAQDDIRGGKQPGGKQSHLYQSHGCDYTRTTGIWQTVWLEFLPQVRVETLHLTPDVASQSVTAQLTLAGQGDLTVAVSYAGEAMGTAHVGPASGTVTVSVPLAAAHLWEIGHGRLYDVRVTFGADQLKSYFGLRSVAFDGEKFRLNGQSVFQRLVLDQGFYPTGIFTAPDDDTFVQDIERSVACGFNGARLHQKVVDPRYLYHCDAAGYLVWGEMASWGIDMANADGLYHFVPEWLAAVRRDWNHPSIVTWCPFNETWDIDGRPQRRDAVAIVYQATKALDATRPCVDTSGNYHGVTDLYDVHDYAQEPAVMAQHFDGEQAHNGAFWDEHEARQHYQAGQPIAVSEYGGIKWAPNASVDEAWGYGEPEDEAAFVARYRGLTEVLLANPHICSFCYTQLYDVEQERNGLYYYDRTPKFAPEQFAAINRQKAAIED